MLLRARRGVTYRGVTLSPPTWPRSPGFLMALTEIRARDGCQPGGRAAAVPPPGQHVLPDGVYPGRGTQPGGTGESTGPGGKKPALRALLRCCRLGQDVTWSRQLPLSFRAGEGGGRSLATVSPSFSRVPAWAPPVTSLLPEVVPKTFRGSVNPLCPSQQVLIPTRSRGCPCPAQGRERVLLEPRRRWRR